MQIIKINIMKIKYIFFHIFLFFYFSYLYPQKKLNIKAEYEYINKNSNSIQNVKLFSNSEEAYSEFFHIKKNIDTVFTDESDENHIHIKKEIKDSIGQQYYLTKKKVTYRDHIYTDGKFLAVIVNESMPLFNWKLESETKKIGNYQCNKASLDFRGRSYTYY